MPLLRRLQSLTPQRPPCLMVDQANQIQIMRHGRKLALNCLLGEQESGIG